MGFHRFTEPHGLPRLADDLLAAVERLADASDADFAAANEAEYAARAAFWGALEAQTGITREVWDRLGGVL